MIYIFLVISVNFDYFLQWEISYYLNTEIYVYEEWIPVEIILVDLSNVFSYTNSNV